MEGLVPFILQGGDKCRLLLHPRTMANSSKTIKMTKISFFPMGKSRYMFLVGDALPCRHSGVQALPTRASVPSAFKQRDGGAAPSTS